MSALITMSDYISDSVVLSGKEHPGDLLMKTCKRCFREFDETECDVVDVSPATELADYVDSRFHGNDKEGGGNNRGRGKDKEGRQTSALKISMSFARKPGKSWA